MNIICLFHVRPTTTQMVILNTRICCYKQLQWNRQTPTICVNVYWMMIIQHYCFIIHFALTMLANAHFISGTKIDYKFNVNVVYLCVLVRRDCVSCSQRTELLIEYNRDYVPFVNYFLCAPHCEMFIHFFFLIIFKSLLHSYLWYQLKLGCNVLKVILCHVKLKIQI